MFKKSLIVGLIIGASVSSYAGKMQSYCYMGENDKEVFGVNADKKLPLASVSKVLTTFSVLSAMGAHTKLYTQFYVSAVAKNLYDVHIKGSRDPYFARASMHTLISRLNEMGVTQIRNLTFDENFKYLYDTNKPNSGGRGFNYDPVTGKSPIDAPSADFVQRLLMNKKQVMLDYEKSRKEAATGGVELVAKPVFAPQKIQQVRSTYQPPESAKKGYVASMELIDIIKYMNWNSNNHVANSLFILAGGKEKVEKLFQEKLKLGPEDVSFVNGSGQNGDLTGNGRAYTSATCKAMVKVQKALKMNLEAQKLRYEDAIAVTGGDIGSTIDAAVYKKFLAPKTVVAKTGTVGVAITLSGMAHTKKGNFFFMYNVEPRQAGKRMKPRAATRFRENEAAKSRSIIGQTLAKEIDSLESGNALGLEITNEKEFKRRKSTGKLATRGQPIEYKTRRYDVVNFEDSGDENAPDEAEDEVEAFQAAAAAGDKHAAAKPSAVAAKAAPALAAVPAKK